MPAKGARFGFARRPALLVEHVVSMPVVAERTLYYRSLDAGRTEQKNQ